MTALIANIDKVRHATGAHTLIVHHSGKNAAQGARGHSSLRAATDTEIEIAKTGENFAVAKIKKQRDLEQADDMGFRLEKMLVGTNKRGKELTSCAFKQDLPDPDSYTKLNSAKDAVDACVVELERKWGRGRLLEIYVRLTQLLKALINHQ